MSRPRRPWKAPQEEPEVKITSRDRVIFPESGQTKGQLADYYAAVAPMMLPFAANRPISLVRCPQGRAKKCFFQKHDSGSFGSHVHQVPIAEKDGGTEDYLYAGRRRRHRVLRADGHDRIPRLGQPIIRCRGARTHGLRPRSRRRARLRRREAGRAATSRTTWPISASPASPCCRAARAYTWSCPSRPDTDWETHKDFSKRFAEALSMAEPERFVATMSKAKRKGKIFIDWLRNQRGSTAVLPYSARARGRRAGRDARSPGTNSRHGRRASLRHRRCEEAARARPLEVA